MKGEIGHKHEVTTKGTSAFTEDKAKRKCLCTGLYLHSKWLLH